MACLTPITLKDIIIKPINGRMIPVHNVVPCGKCLGCLASRRAAWTLRILEEEKNCKSSSFTTLTYNDENLPKNQSLNKKHLQNYFKRLRHKASKLRYYGVGEYGSENFRPHYHAIIFNASVDDIADSWIDYDRAENDALGFVRVDKVTPASIHYVTKYITNLENTKYQNMGLKKPFALMSKRMGLTYVEKAKDYHISNTTLTTILPGGSIQALPRYYREKIFEDYPELLSKIIDQVKDEILDNPMTFEEKNDQLLYLKHVYSNNSKSKKL